MIAIGITMALSGWTATVTVVAVTTVTVIRPQIDTSRIRY